MTRRDVRAVEIDDDEAAARLCGEVLPDGTEVIEVDELEFWGTTYEQTSGGLYVPVADDAVERAVERYLDRANPEPTQLPIGMDLFAGCGGFSLGMHAGGFDVVAAVEWDESATETYLTNLGHPDCQIHFATEPDGKRWQKYLGRRVSKHAKPRGPDWIGSAYRRSKSMVGGCRAFFFGDVRAVTGQQMMEAAGVESVDIVFGGPPCQGLSKANTKACLEDPRNGMLWEFLRLVEEIRPKVFLIENVPALLTVAKGALFNALSRIANEAGYNIVANKVDACDYGVPQYRVRAFVQGTRDGIAVPNFPMPTHWSMGRPVQGDGWAMGEEEERMEKSLPVVARYDRATRTWSYDGAAPATPVKVPQPKTQRRKAQQPDLFASHGEAGA